MVGEKRIVMQGGTEREAEGEDDHNGMERDKGKEQTRF